MTQLLIDAMDNAGNWSAFAADGITPSTAISLADDTTHVRFGADAKSGRLTASVNALNHTLRRALPALNLTNLDEIRLWLQSNRVADTSPTRPFFLEVRLASAAMGINDPANTWSRYMPAWQAATWELARLSLAGLHPQVRNAVNLIQLRCVDATVAFTCYLDDVLAVHEELIGDVDAALLQQLHLRATVGGTPVPALIIHPENPPTTSIPSIRIAQYDLQYARERTTFTQLRTDFTASGFQLRPASIAYDLYYAIDIYADTRQHKTQLMEFVLRTLLPRTQLLVNGTQLPLEWVTVEPLDATGKWRSERELLYFKVGTGQEVGTSEPVVPPYHSITVELDQKA